MDGSKRYLGGKSIQNHSRSQKAAGWALASEPQTRAEEVGERGQVPGLELEESPRGCSVNPMHRYCSRPQPHAGVGRGQVWRGDGEGAAEEKETAAGCWCRRGRRAGAAEVTVSFPGVRKERPVLVVFSCGGRQAGESGGAGRLGRGCQSWSLPELPKWPLQARDEGPRSLRLSRLGL